MSVFGELRKEASGVVVSNPAGPRLVQEPVRERRTLSEINPGHDPLEPGNTLGRPPFDVFQALPKRAAGKHSTHAKSAGHTSDAEKSPVNAPLAGPVSEAEIYATQGNASAAATLKIPMQAQIAVMHEMQSGQRDIQVVALEILQSNFRWPGMLKIEARGQDQPPSSPPNPERMAVALQFGKHKLGQLVLEGNAKSARVTDQLQQCATWLSSILAMSRTFKNLRNLADTDELSGAYNRRFFMENVPALLERARKERFCVTILLFDIDDFKQYNDQFGHAAGDAIIREVIGLLRHCTRNRDLVARIGGDEFAVVFWDEGGPRQPDSQHPRTVLSIAQRFRKAVAEHPWNTQGGPISGRLSISGGLATYPWDAQNLVELLAVADGEMLRAKSMGKNAIVLAGPGNSEADPAVSPPPPPNAN